MSSFYGLVSAHSPYHLDVFGELKIELVIPIHAHSLTRGHGFELDESWRDLKFMRLAGPDDVDRFQSRRAFVSCGNSVIGLEAA